MCVCVSRRVGGMEILSRPLCSRMVAYISANLCRSPYAMNNAAKAHACTLALSLAEEVAMLGQVDVSVRTGAGSGRREEAA